MKKITQLKNRMVLTIGIIVLGLDLNAQNCDETLPVAHTQITEDELSVLLENDGITTSLEGDFIYKVVINAGGGVSTHTEMIMCLDGQIPVSGTAKGESDDVELYRTQIGTDPALEDLYEFNGMGWMDVVAYTGSSELYMILDSKWGSDIDTWIYYWFGTNQPIDELGYGLLDDNDDDFGSIYVEAYEMITQQGCDEIIPVVHTQITEDELSVLLENDGITTGLEGDFIYKVVINAGGGVSTHTEMIMCLDGQIPVSGTAKGESDDVELYRTQIGTDPALEDLYEFNGMGWMDVVAYTGSSELYMILDSKWGSDIDTWIYYWFGTNQPINELGYGLLDDNDDDFGSINVEAYELDFTSINEESKKDGISIYPNPSKNIIHIYCDDEREKSIEMMIYNSYGQQVSTVRTDKFIDLSGFDSGIYHVIIRDEHNRIIQSNTIVVLK